MPEKNALAELAEWLDWTITVGRLSIEVPTNVQCDRHYLLEAFKRAQRIVAELAKYGNVTPPFLNMKSVFENCRAIAEEAS